MPDFQFRVSPRVLLGADTLNRLPLVVSEFGSRVLLVADPYLYESKTIERVLSLLEGEEMKTIVFDEIQGSSGSRAAEEATNLARGSRANAVVGIGGVRTLSIAKAAAMAATGTYDLDSIIDGKRPENRGLPFISVPTTLRDPFLLGEGLFLSDARDRSAKMVNAQVDITRAVILDPKLSVSMSGKACALAVLELIMQAVEGYTSAKASFFSDTVLEKAFKLLFQALDNLIARPDDPQARNTAIQASFLTALGVSASSLGLGTATALSINARYDVPKSSLAAILIPYVMEEAAKARVEKVAFVAEAAGEEWEGDSASEGARKAIEAVRQRLGSLKVPTRLKDFDLELDPLASLAAATRNLDMMSYLPRKISADDVYDLMKQAF